MSLSFCDIARNTKRNRLVVFSALVLVTSLFAALADAADATSDKPNREPESLVVSAARVSSTILEAPTPVMVYTEDDIKQRKAIFLEEIIKGTPGVHLTRAGGFGGLAAIRMRGGEANHVKLRMDGIDLNDPVQDQANLSYLSTVGFKQVEILLGPQSSIWGSDALSGTINLDTTPMSGTQKAHLSVSAGNLGSHLESAEFSRNQGRYHINVSASNFDTQGSNFALQGNERDAYRNSTGHLNFGYSTEQVKTQVILRYTDATYEYDPVMNGLAQDGDLDSYGRQFYGSWRLAITQAENWEYSIGLTTLDANYRDRLNGNTTTLREGTRIKLEGQVSYQRNHHRFTLASEYYEEGFGQQAEATRFGDPNYQQTQSQLSFVGEYGLTIPKMSLVLSARSDQNNAFRNSITYRVSGRYRIQESTFLGASFATGIKNPGFIERYGYSPDTFLGNADLKPEQSRSLSLNVEQRFKDAVTLSVAWFRARLDDEINGFVFDRSRSAFTAANVQGVSRRNGVEVSAQISPSDWSELTFAYTRLSAKQPIAGTKEYEQELRRPVNSGKIFFDVERKRFNAQIGWVFVGAVYDNNFGVFPAARVKLDSYNLLHITGRFTLNERWALHGKVNNLLQESYQEVYGYGSIGRHFLFGFDLSL